MKLKKLEVNAFGKIERRKQLEGKVFGKLTVIEKKGINYRRQAMWLCKCKCGNTTEVRTQALTSGHTKSCGCLQKEVAAKLLKTHGQSSPHTPEYNSWNSMIERCFNPNNKAYPNYGGRGITVCKRWLKFKNFFKDMGKRPSINHSLDRFPNNATGIYKKSNCRWATKKEQANNIRSNVFIEYKGERIILSDFKRLLNTKSQWYLTLLKTQSPEQVVLFYKNKQNNHEIKTA